MFQNLTTTSSAAAFESDRVAAYRRHCAAGKPIHEAARLARAEALALHANDATLNKVLPDQGGPLSGQEVAP